MSTTVSQLFLSVRALSSSGLAPTEVFQSSQFKELLSSLDKSVENRSKVVSALRKRKREEQEDETELEMRKRKALKKIDETEEYEAYRRQCWVQYYEWAAQQQSSEQQASNVKPLPEEPTVPIDDEDIDKLLLGL